MPKKSSSAKNGPFKNLKEGAFTSQARQHNMTNKQFAAYVIKSYKNKSSDYSPSLTTFRRAMFYKNFAK